MRIENIIAALICLVAAVVYTVLAIRAEKARLYHQKKGDSASEVIEQITKLWETSATTHKKVTKCENCHENTAMATVDHKLLCKSCYEQIEVQE
ncbi:hypothetical protein [Lactococcus garvieae]|uniref:hypothetical protein n=1 Tax=Lactococcus garvieae TaxID=1363 RepID=UPI0013FDF3A1|nr:hypothetical protein [Lactococcus garvieae]NHI70076.1 hypothetical protein [Lactococcus garvieae]NHJ08098.1 hypothetical protein [Lactococcus garvieae]